MTKHTPGPWYYTKTPIIGFIVRSSSSKSDTGRDKFVADCGKVHHDPFSAEFEANAALIAAAPELLEVARDAANQLRTIAAIANHIPRKYAAQILPLIRYGDIDEVVAKAEGKA